MALAAPRVHLHSSPAPPLSTSRRRSPRVLLPGNAVLRRRQTMFFDAAAREGLSSSSSPSPAAAAAAASAGNPVTLVEYVGNGAGDDLSVLFTHLQYACKRIAAQVASPFNAELGRRQGGTRRPLGDCNDGEGRPQAARRDLGKFRLNEIILSSLIRSRKVAAMASEEDDAPVWMADDGPFVVVTDPSTALDHLPSEEKASLNSLQSGARLVAAAYVLYSSATIFCLSFGSGTHAFTLDHSTGEFVLTHPFIKIPPRGQIYSVNDARYFDWPEGLRRYIDTYSARYICSLVADFHRTLMYGGVTMNPRDHLRLVYEANPLSYLAENAGGRGSDGKLRILSIQPVELHQRLPLFLGSPEDMEELESYGDVQQKINPGYEL
ncbi:unnamed protein product [Spirodela intermedia]|uniref:fructose-bisphosphatase n=1 Tax=Spirodela intermedia TaxID=51605 RepID=A0A7I8JBQ5_SPIIN|nr:unnamed protein product [Spirodela intermedia]CAA6667529.1 unnamed protein product [Spirodela intermedia]